MSQKEYIQVWDLLVRMFHWSFVVFVLIAFFSGDEKSVIHLYSGYTVLGLLFLRIVWGFVGGKYARFTNFIYLPTQAIQYLKEIRQGSPQYYIGHNPAAGWMVIVLLIMLVFVCVTGHMAYKIKGQGLAVQGFAFVKYAHADSDEDEGQEYLGNESKENEYWEDVHEATSLTLIILILLHISGALVSSKLHHENLVKAMITGEKEKRPKI